MEVRKNYGEKYIPADVVAELKMHQDLIPHYPKEGVGYLDIFSLLGDRKYCRKVYDAVAALFDPDSYDVIVAPEARGFIIGSALSYITGKPFVPARKIGKSPRAVVRVAYALEYSNDEALEIQIDRIYGGSRVLIVDDLIATGGTVKAIADVLRSDLCCTPIGVAVVNSLDYLPRVELPKDCPVRAVIHHDKAPKLPKYDPDRHGNPDVYAHLSSADGGSSLCPLNESVKEAKNGD